MDISNLDLTPEEQRQYQMGKEAGFTDDEIIQHFSGAKSSTMMDAEGKQVSVNPEAPLVKPGQITGMGAPGVVQKPVPEWRQAGVKAARALPEIGQAVGTAAGLSTMLVPGAQPSAAYAVPAGGAAGRIAGKAGESLLTKMLLPKADVGFTPEAVTSAGAEGASSAMLDTMFMRGGAELGKTRPFEALEGVFDPEKTASAKVRNKLTKKLLQPSQKNPEEARRVVSNVGKAGIDIAGGEGPQQVHNRIANLSAKVDSIIEKAQASGATVKTADLQEPLMKLWQQYTDAGLTKEARAIAKEIRGLSSLPIELDPVKAQSIKKTIYSTINGPAWEQFASPPGVKARKSFSSGLADELEAVSGPELGQTNQELGKLLEMRPYVTKGAEKAQEAGFTGGIKNQLTQKGASLAERLNKVQRGAPKAEPRDLSIIGSPYQNLEEMFGISYKGKGIGDKTKQLEYAPRGEGTQYGTPPKQQTKLPGSQRLQLTGPTDKSKLLTDAGLRFDGVSTAKDLGLPDKGQGRFYWFTDPETKSSGLLPESELTAEKIAAHIKASREKFLQGSLDRRKNPVPDVIPSIKERRK